MREPGSQGLLMRTKSLALVVACAVVTAPAICRADLIDRVLAIVGTSVITQSDVAAALSFGLISEPAAGSDPVAVGTEALIRRQLILDEVNRYAPADVDDALVSARMKEIRARFTSPESFDAAMARTAMNETRLRDAVEADIRIDEYMKQRFGVAEPGDDEVAAFYAAHRGDFTIAGRQLSLQEAGSAVRQRMVEEKRAALIDEWVTRLRRRAEVTNLYFAETRR